jgi:hypothetical protein
MIRENFSKPFEASAYFYMNIRIRNSPFTHNGTTVDDRDENIVLQIDIANPSNEKSVEFVLS